MYCKTGNDYVRKKFVDFFIVITDLLPLGAAPSCNHYPICVKIAHPFLWCTMAGDMCENVTLLCCIITFLQLHGDQCS